MENKLTGFFDRVLILKYVLTSFAKWLIIGLVTFGLIFAVLSLAGLYGQVVSVLDLKYNSPFVLVPLYTFIALAIVCFIVGFLLYFHKYKRSGSTSKFNKAFKGILDGTRHKRVSERTGGENEK